MQNHNLQNTSSLRAFITSKLENLSNIKILNQTGKVYTILIEGNVATTLEKFYKEQPILIEELTMSLEDVLHTGGGWICFGGLNALICVIFYLGYYRSAQMELDKYYEFTRKRGTLLFLYLSARDGNSFWLIVLIIALACLLIGWNVATNLIHYL